MKRPEITKDDALQRFSEVRKTMLSLFVGALTVIFSQTLVTYLNIKLQSITVVGIDFQVFELILLGAIILVLAYFGLLKTSTNNMASPSK